MVMLTPDGVKLEGVRVNAHRTGVRRHYVMSFVRLLAALAMVAMVACAPPQEPPYVIVISIDGLKPSVYTQPGPAKIPTLRSLASGGAWADGVIGVTPTNTYPSHTTLITGVPPAVHGIFDNRILDIDDTSGGSWYWYARDIKVPTLLSAANVAGHSTAAVNWPVTVDAPADYLVPEFGGVYAHPIWANLVRALTHPIGLLDTYEAAGNRVPWPMNDADYMSVATWVFRTYRPHLMLVHLFDVDDREHVPGPDAPEALAAIENADAQVKRMVDAVDAAGLRSRTNIVVVSDHGFQTTEQELRPNFAFKEAGLLEEDDYGRIRRWDAYFQTAGGSGFVMLSRPDDELLRGRVAKVLNDLAANPANGIETIWTQSDLQTMGADPRAVFGIDMKDGFYTGAWHEPLLTRAGSRGGHGFAPTRTAMHASLVMNGPNVGAGGSLGVVRMTQIAPTIASWIGASLAQGADAALALPAARP